MSSQYKPLATLIEDAIKLLSRPEARQSGLIRITVTNEEGDTITITLDQGTLSCLNEEPIVRRSLSDLENSILELLRQVPKALRGKEIAAGIGKAYTSHFREILSDLTNRKIISRTTEGYKLRNGTSSLE